MSDVPEMVTKVAMALCTKLDCGMCRETKLHVCDAYAFHDAARASIAAMREPNDKVIYAVEQMAEDRYRAAPAMLRWYGEDVWAAGIDAALGNPPVAR